MIRFENITKSYGDNRVIADLNFEIAKGEFFVLIGPSGSGKTTTLKMINRLITPSQGDIYLNDKNITDISLRELRLDMGYVLQQIALFPNLTVRENIELIPEMKAWSKADRLEKTKKLLDKAGLPADKYLERYPRDLSGGEQQRVGILRAIIANPHILLMDEPFSALDPISRKQLQDLTLSLQKELGMTVVFVTHDIEEAKKLADRIAIFQKGRIIQLASPKDMAQNPVNDFVADLFGGDS
ncbi:ABC transporter ATP-binding protein [Streptococcus mutans]|nr:ABC transporter ATP-binding protein [Streptococcus mutans]MCB4997703.1 ABC transporter ATP-binding protein [Streptococcus mutans]MCB5039255.1 ABC transporter ATP-binding protein [Streptococcus mutans]MCB5064283.1 ABC transporter ATP-binding protein [Streptococcus mutans]MCB5109733.1 ABC transporter ATP-binding protein [Streptococcus mutans]